MGGVWEVFGWVEGEGEEVDACRLVSTFFPLLLLSRLRDIKLVELG